MEVNEFFKQTVKYYEEDGDMQLNRPVIICKDSTTLSVQASFGHYCNPKENGHIHYDLVEVGYPSAEVPLSWKEYQEVGSSIYICIPVYEVLILKKL